MFPSINQANRKFISYTINCAKPDILIRGIDELAQPEPRRIKILLQVSLSRTRPAVEHYGLLPRL